MVIVEYVHTDYALITGFCVDQSNQAYYIRKLQNRKKRIYGNAANQVFRSSIDDVANLVNFGPADFSGA